MSHLFNTGSYIQFSLNNLNGMKRQLANKLQRAAESINDDLHPNTYQEDIVIDNSSFAFSYQGQIINFPSQILDLPLENILNPTNIQENLDEEEIQQLVDLLPNKNKSDFNYLFQINQLNGSTPIQNFERKLKKGYYTSLREREQAIMEKLNQQRMKQIYTDLFNIIKQRRQEQNQQRVKRFSFKDNQDSVESLQNLESRIQPSDNSDATQSEIQQNQEEFEDYQNQVFYRYDYTKLKMQEQLLIIGEDKGDRKITALKNMVTVKPRNSEWVQNFRKQQFQRYSNPTKPWIYVCEDGRKVTVAPVAKKMSVLSGKPRFHPMLKNERPACVTILTLARDAAARLPNGVGTRADICQLVKQSQYITQGLSDERLSATISGALDRLHYMTDACVKYDSQKKLWIYLHIDRNQEHPGWGQDGEQYIEKNSGKKKKFNY